MSISADPVPAILENEAKGEILEIFFDIKEITGSGVVNLVWRHLAVTPNALQVLWKMLRPIYVSGLVIAEAKSFRESLTLPSMSPLSVQALKACGIDALGHKNIINILSSYNRTNVVNLIGLSAGLARIEDLNVPLGLPADYIPDSPLTPLPPLPPMSDLDQHIRELVLQLNDIFEEDGTIVASMYRHLTYWPGYLGLISTLLESYSTNDFIKSGINGVRLQAKLRGAGIANELSGLDENTKAETVEVIKTVLKLFIRHPLSKMTVICGSLLAATPELKQ